MSEKLACIILAAGKGTRMKSSLPKPLHPVAGRSMVEHVLAAARELNPEKIVVVIGPDMEDVADAVAPWPCAIQVTANGTGGAVLAAKQELEHFDGDIAVLFSDTPLITPDTIRAMIDKRREKPETGLVYSGMMPDDPGQYGRMVLNDDGTLDRIVEYRDATDEERRIRLCNGGILCADGSRLFDWLGKIGNDNDQGEYYLTDLPPIARAENRDTRVAEAPAEEMEGINSRADLAKLEKMAQRRLREKAMENGVTLTDPDSVFFCHDTQLGQDVTIGPNVVFGPGVTVADNVTIHPFCHLEGVAIKAHASVGPFARLRPGTQIGEHAKIGNFVELKNAVMGDGAKASHLSYLGDATIGAKSNIGAGTITCNYDGFLKYKTTIGDGAFIGSNTALVAPIEIGRGAIVGAGSTLSKDIPEDSLAVERSKAKVFEDWATEFREKKSKEKAQKGT